MMVIRSTLIISCLLLSPVTSITPAGSWNHKERATWLATQRYLDTAYSLNSPEYRSPYPYDIALSSSEVESAWNYAKQPSTGPVYKNVYQGSPGSVYVLTKIPGDHPLFSSRNFDTDGVSKNAFLFWKVKKNRHKLLGVEIRAVGAPTEPLYTMEEVLREHRML
ncbi:hypothetical protein PHBOTO_003596 [Pseudozyma hubeiensis]|nr:hypothetical protein PHBOTO_003596 [Pseudozyma hubeiensis]